MPSLEEAREQAWIKRASDLGSFASISAQLEFSTGWDARGQYDEQCIAALVAAVVGVREANGANLGDKACEQCGALLTTSEGDLRVINDYSALWEALRPLAGQLARDEVPE